jgi:hypothetical protein
VSLFYKGVQIALPLAIGIKDPVILINRNGFPVAVRGSCTYHTHTHDQSGLIHIEALTVGTYTLGNVFDIWGEPLSSSPVNVAGFRGPLLVYLASCASGVPFICDPPTQYTGDPRAIVLAQHLQITLEVGGPYVWPPYYQWSF